MADRLTTFDQFEQHRAKRQQAVDSRDDVAREDAAQATYADLVALLNETARLVKHLDHATQRDLARALAAGTIEGGADMGQLARGYERLSWRLCGQIRGILNNTAKG